MRKDVKWLVAASGLFAALLAFYSGGRSQVSWSLAIWAGLTIFALTAVPLYLMTKQIDAIVKSTTSRISRASLEALSIVLVYFWLCVLGEIAKPVGLHFGSCSWVLDLNAGKVAGFVVVAALLWVVATVSFRPKTIEKVT